MRIQLAIPERFVTAPVLDGALEAVTRLNEEMIKQGASPTSFDLLKKGAIWKPEPPGDEHFDHGKKIEERGWGDCDDWGPLHAATLRVLGIDPGARSLARRSGPNRWHATTVLSNGMEDDPSLKAGMPGRGRRVGYRGAYVPTMFERPSGVDGTFIASPQLALRPVADRHGEIESWQARADLPWHWHPGNSPGDVAMATLHMSPLPDQAIAGAVLGAHRLGIASGFADPEDCNRMAAVAAACDGYSWSDLAEVWGPETATYAGNVVGSFFGKALKKLGKVAKGAVKLASPALSLVPGGSVATAAFNMASPHLKKSVAKQQHIQPSQRHPVRVAPAPAAQQRAHVMRVAPAPAPAPGAPPAGNWLPYPYPVPYPVPNWGAGEAPTPGMAWPPRA